MAEHPILFSAPMVRAILAGKKTQTRRVVKPQPNGGPRACMVDLGGATFGLSDGDLSGEWPCPYGAPGDTLWVRETWEEVVNSKTDGARATWDGSFRPAYRATEPGLLKKWRSPLHMPRKFSRLSLRVLSVRVERVQEISEADARAEGCGLLLGDELDADVGARARVEFSRLWDSINGKRAPWDSNPWVWVVEFERVAQAVRP